MTTPDNHPARVLGQTRELNPGISVTCEIRTGQNGAERFGEFVGEIRRAFIVAPADTFFSVPARVSLNGRKIAGYVSVSTVQGFDTETADDPAIYIFRPYLYGSNVR